MLQWGRRLSTAEISEVHWLAPTRDAASMGPPSLNGGNENMIWLQEPDPELQWGRRLSTAEILAVGRRFTWAVGRFNGAAVSQRRKFLTILGLSAEEGQLQWGRRLSTAEITILAMAATGRRPLQWGRRLSTAEIEHKHRHWAITVGRSASMGPPSLNGGNTQECGPGGTHGPGFNGAAVSQRRKS